jgi:hypothetical protein
MKGFIAAIVLLVLGLAAPAAAQLPGASAGPSAVLFDGTDAFVNVACGREEGDCIGEVSLVAADAGDVAIGGPVGFSIDAESADRVKVPITAAGIAALESARQVVVVIGGVPAVRQVERIRTESGIGPGQVEVSPQARQRNCRQFTRVSEIKVRGIECADAKSLIGSVASRGSRCATRCTVRGFTCTGKKSGKTARRFDCTTETQRVRWRRSTR